MIGDRKARVWRTPYTPPRQLSIGERLHALSRYGDQRRPAELLWRWQLPTATGGHLEGEARTQQEALRQVCTLIAFGWWR